MSMLICATLFGELILRLQEQCFANAKNTICDSNRGAIGWDGGGPSLNWIAWMSSQLRLQHGLAFYRHDDGRVLFLLSTNLLRNLLNRSTNLALAVNISYF